MRVIKSNTSHQTAIFVVLEPETVDRNGDIVAVDTITNACHEFMLNLTDKAVNFDHEDGTDTEDAAYVENYILPMDLEGTDDAGNDYVIKAGSWMVGIQFSDTLWQDLLDGKITGISLEGTGQYF